VLFACFLKPGRDETMQEDDNIFLTPPRFWHNLSEHRKQAALRSAIHFHRKRKGHANGVYATEE
jgi:hypothetical protein